MFWFKIIFFRFFILFRFIVSIFTWHFLEFFWSKLLSELSSCNSLLSYNPLSQLFVYVIQCQSRNSFLSNFSPSLFWFQFIFVLILILSKTSFWFRGFGIEFLWAFSKLIFIVIIVIIFVGLTCIKINKIFIWVQNFEANFVAHEWAFQQLFVITNCLNNLDNIELRIESFLGLIDHMQDPLLIFPTKLATDK